jgi:hypothetical protein
VAAAAPKFLSNQMDGSISRFGWTAFVEYVTATACSTSEVE